MRYKISSLLLSALVVGCLSAQASPLPPAGEDNRLIWQTVTSWPTAGQPVDIVHSLDGKLVFILNSEHQVIVYDTKGQVQGRIPVNEGVTAIDIAPQGNLLYLVDNKNNTFTVVATDFVYDIDVTGSPFKGPADAPVTIAVFSDFE